MWLKLCNNERVNVLLKKNTKKISRYTKISKKFTKYFKNVPKKLMLMALSQFDEWRICEVLGTSIRVNNGGGVVI